MPKTTHTNAHSHASDCSCVCKNDAHGRSLFIGTSVRVCRNAYLVDYGYGACECESGDHVDRQPGLTRCRVVAVLRTRSSSSVGEGLTPRTGPPYCSRF